MQQFMQHRHGEVGRGTCEIPAGLPRVHNGNHRVAMHVLVSGATLTRLGKTIWTRTPTLDRAVTRIHPEPDFPGVRRGSATECWTVRTVRNDRTAEASARLGIYRHPVSTTQEIEKANGKALLFRRIERTGYERHDVPILAENVPTKAKRMPNLLPPPPARTGGRQRSERNGQHAPRPRR